MCQITEEREFERRIRYSGGCYMLRCDSRQIEKGDSFIAISGENIDGHQYIEDAIEAGATKIIAEYGSYEVETIIVPDTKEYLKQYIETYKEQLKDMHIIGMTGTNGKTTTCFLLYQALNQVGKKCAYIGTIGFYIERKIRDLHNTTPEILELYEMLLEAKEAGCTYVVMEVSSHALQQERVYGLQFEVAIISNITREHLDYHKTMKDYALAKQKLFYQVAQDGIAIIPTAIDFYSLFILPTNHNITYGKDGDYQMTSIHLEKNKSLFTLLHNEEEKSYEISLIGEYNVYNMINVIIVLEYLGIPNIEQIVLNLTPPPGRMDQISDQDNLIIVDYAHTPDAVENVLNLVHQISNQKVYVIIGCGGNRDKEKRPLMAEIATRLSDHVIFTTDNPRNEEPKDIIKDMTQNIKNSNYEIELDRTEAIHKGIDLLKGNDILLILGKGHENYQIVKGEKQFFDDKITVFNYLNQK